MRRVLLLVASIVLVDTLFYAALTPLLPHYEDTLGLGKAGAGVLAAAYPAGAMFGAIPSGIVAARVGVKPTVLVGMLVVALTTFPLEEAAGNLAGRERLLDVLASEGEEVEARADVAGARRHEDDALAVGDEDGALRLFRQAARLEGEGLAIDENGFTNECHGNGASRAQLPLRAA